MGWSCGVGLARSKTSQIRGLRGPTYSEIYSPGLSTEVSKCGRRKSLAYAFRISRHDEPFINPLALLLPCHGSKHNFSVALPSVNLTNGVKSQETIQKVT